MDRESYEDPEIARIINDHFVAVKVDRDERPDVDARYQAAVSAISGQGGWPLDGISYAGWQAVLWRNVFSSRRSLWAARIWPGVIDDVAGVARAARRSTGICCQRDVGHRA